MQGANLAILSRDEVRSKVDDRLCDSRKSSSLMAVLRELRGDDSDSDDDSIFGASYDVESSSVSEIDERDPVTSMRDPDDDVARDDIAPDATRKRKQDGEQSPLVDAEADFTAEAKPDELGQRKGRRRRIGMSTGGLRAPRKSCPVTAAMELAQGTGQTGRIRSACCCSRCCMADMLK